MKTNRKISSFKKQIFYKEDFSEPAPPTSKNNLYNKLLLPSITSFLYSETIPKENKKLYPQKCKLLIMKQIKNVF